MKTTEPLPLFRDFKAGSLVRILRHALRELALLAGVVISAILPLMVRAGGEDKPPASGEVRFAQAPEGAKILTIPLTVLEAAGARPQGYLTQRSPQPAEPITSLPPAIAATYTGKEWVAFEILRIADGTRYLGVLSEDKSIKFLNRQESSMWYARVYRVGTASDAKPEVLKEGFQSSGNDV